MNGSGGFEQAMAGLDRVCCVHGRRLVSEVASSGRKPNGEGKARILRTHSDRWMERYPGSMQHDGLTLAAAMFWPGIRFARERVALDPVARMTRSEQGTEIIMSISADYGAFMSWLGTALHGALTT